MKLPILLGALLLSASPVLADDYLYLKCEESWEGDVLHAQTSKYIKKESKSYVGIYKIALKDQTIKGVTLGERDSVKTYNIQIDNDQLTYSEALDVGTG